MAGVAFTRDPNGGGPYFIINYDDSSGRTDLVTSGASGDLKTFCCLKTHPEAVPAPLVPIVRLLCELEALLASDALDIEFAVDQQGTLYLLQVRRLTTNTNSAVPTAGRIQIRSRADCLQDRTPQPPASLSSRQPLRFRSNAGLESRRDHRTAPKNLSIDALSGTHH